MPRRRILLGQLISYGDCLYATTIARQIKHDHPDSHLTWAISQRCRNILEQNPHVDSIWEWPSFPNEEVTPVWDEFCRQAEARKERGDFDQLVLTQFAGANFSRWDGNLRAALFRGYPEPITVPLDPVVHLSRAEVENVARFAAAHGLTRLSEGGRGVRPVILFECSPGSAQSSVTPEAARRIASKLLVRLPTTQIILSTHEAVSDPNGDPRIIIAEGISFRENAELSHYCTLLVGCSSGISWLCTSEAARPLPMIQILSKASLLPNSLVADHRRWGLSTDSIIELYDPVEESILACLESAVTDKFREARGLFHEDPPSGSRSYRHFFRSLIHLRKYREALVLFCRNLPQLLRIPATLLWHLPYLLRWILWQRRQYPAPEMVRS